MKINPSSKDNLNLVKDKVNKHDFIFLKVILVRSKDNVKIKEETPLNDT
jgi:hypothetical protein